MNIIITGGAGFIGSHLVRLMVNKYPDYTIYNLDKLTYAGNLENLSDIELKKNYHFIKGDICDSEFIIDLFNKIKPDSIIHLAAESHVDRSIINPMEFLKTNILGTVNLLNSFRAILNDKKSDNIKRIFYHVSTDEVYGSLGENDKFTENTPYDPHSPYSASKAGSDHFVKAYFHTYKIPVGISNCSNNYGPNQFPEKLIPLVINNIKNNKPIPVYGKGENVRDWLFVEDHAIAIDLIFHKGLLGETYNIGGLNEWNNIELIHLLCKILDKKLNRQEGTSAKLITFVTDRPGHDFRYAIDCSKLQNELGWAPSVNFEKGLEKTVDWYLKNNSWLNNVTSGEYQKYYKAQYRN